MSPLTSAPIKKCLKKPKKHQHRSRPKLTVVSFLAKFIVDFILQILNVVRNTYFVLIASASLNNFIGYYNKLKIWIYIYTCFLQNIFLSNKWGGAEIDLFVMHM